MLSGGQSADLALTLRQDEETTHGSDDEAAEMLQHNLSFLIKFTVRKQTA